VKFFRLLLLVFVLVVSILLSAKNRTPVVAADPDYISALGAANHFLQAWETRDYETGIVMLTDAAKQGISEERLDALFSPEHPGQRAYEVMHGRKLQAGRYAFPVALFENGKGRGNPRYSQIVVVRESKEEWVVDKLL
jgi:hypothetical protein